VKKYVEFFLAFLIAIDLVALMLKLTHLFSTGGAYERSAAALRATDLVEVHRLQERANVLTRRITLESRAQQDADELRIRGEISLRSDQLGPNELPGRRPPLGGPATAAPPRRLWTRRSGSVGWSVGYTADREAVHVSPDRGSWSNSATSSAIRSQKSDACASEMRACRMNPTASRHGRPRPTPGGDLEVVEVRGQFVAVRAPLDADVEHPRRAAVETLLDRPHPPGLTTCTNSASASTLTWWATVLLGPPRAPPRARSPWPPARGEGPG
jgi:hypothetical protein